MRVSSLSDEKVINLLTKYFIPVWVSRDHYQLDAPSNSEKDELLRIDRDRAKRGLEGGTVSVFILAPDGDVFASMSVQRAYKPENLAPFLQKIVDDRHLEARSPKAVKDTTAQARPAAHPKTDDGMMLHVYVRDEGMKDNRGLSQDWVEWSAAEWQTLAPAADARPGSTLALPREPAGKLFRRLYPPAPRWDARDAELASGKLTATVVSSDDREVRLKLEGEADVIFPSTGHPTDGRIKAKLVGAARYDATKHRFTSFVLTSEQAENVWYWEGKTQLRKLLMAVEMER
jgi:hypothetical protein